jgi:hypothetical protein
MSEPKEDAPDANRDPITGAPGAHPVGVGIGTAGGATIGAAVGSFAGPGGTAVGAAVGGVVGGLTGKSLAESINPTVEDEYWRENYGARPYVKEGVQYSDYQPAYQFGWEGRSRFENLTWDEAEPKLREEWRLKDDRVLEWSKASPAVKDAWYRIEREMGRKE